MDTNKLLEQFLGAGRNMLIRVFCLRQPIRHRVRTSH